MTVEVVGTSLDEILASDAFHHLAARHYAVSQDGDSGMSVARAQSLIPAIADELRKTHGELVLAHGLRATTDVGDRGISEPLQANTIVDVLLCRIPVGINAQRTL